MPTVWVDADACPRAVKDVLFRASERTGLPVVLVANHPLRTPDQGNVRSVQVAHGFDVADEWIAEKVEPGDLVISADIALELAALEQGATVIEFRGENVSLSTARSRMRMKDLLEDLRQSGQIGGGPSAWSKRDTKRFAQSFDGWLEGLRSR